MTRAHPEADTMPLLTTKLHPPRRRPTLIVRPRLGDLANRTRPALTLVSAPAGFGKTTLVADWFASERTTAWLSLDSRDEPAAVLDIRPRCARDRDRRLER